VEHYRFWPQTREDTLDWLYFGHIGGLTVRMAKILVALDGKDGVQ
jgi:hypothetical protein